MLGCVPRDIERKCANTEGRLVKVLNFAKAIFSQKREDKNKVYSVHAPEVECIAKGKVHKKYEFGCKVSMVSSSSDKWILAIDALHGNPFDGHTLKNSLEQAKKHTGWQPLHAYCDKGYRGVARDIPDTEVHLSGKKKKSMKASLWKWFSRRSAIEPIFGHLKIGSSVGTESSPGERRRSHERDSVRLWFQPEKAPPSFLFAFFPEAVLAIL